MPERELELIQAVRAGDQGALSELVRLYFDRMERHGRRLCGNREDAEEVLQETFAVAIASIPDIRHDSGFRSWLYKVASSICTKKRRRRREESGHDVEVASEALLQQTHLPPDVRMDDAELQAMLEKGIGKLSKGLRNALSLVYFQGLSGKEAASRLGIEPEALRTRLVRARQELKAAFTALKKK